MPPVTGTLDPSDVIAGADIFDMLASIDDLVVEVREYGHMLHVLSAMYPDHGAARGAE